MHRRNNNANADVEQLAFDLIAVALAYLSAGGLYWFISGNNVIAPCVWMCVIYCVLFVLYMWSMRMYNVTTFHYLDRLLYRLACATVMALLSVLLVMFLMNSYSSRPFFLLFCVLGYLYVLATRLVVRAVRRRHIGNGFVHALFIGDAATLQNYRRFVEKSAMKVTFDQRLEYGNPCLVCPDAFEAKLVELAVDDVLFVYDPDTADMPTIRSLTRVCEDMGVTARVILKMFDMPHSERFVCSVGSYPVMTYHSTSCARDKLFWKGLMDVAGALIGLVLTSPLLLLTALAIKLESPGPVLFRQKRVGINGKVFTMYKFRSMYRDAEARKAELAERNRVADGLMFKVDDDPRVTRVGRFIRKTSIDELPQLINVLLRDMSLVGTRPPTLDEVEKYNRHHRFRLSIMPGITGLWQVSGRSDITRFEDVVRLDRQYIQEWSLLLDLKLIFKTVAVVLRRSGAC